MLYANTVVKTRLNSNASTKTCPHCSKTFSGSSNLERHVKTKHRIAEEFDCEVCQLNLPSKEMLESHVKSDAVECKADVSSKDYPKASKSGGFNAKEKDFEVKCFYCEKFEQAKTCGDIAREYCSGGCKCLSLQV